MHLSYALPCHVRGNEQKEGKSHEETHRHDAGARRRILIHSL